MIDWPRPQMSERRKSTAATSSVHLDGSRAQVSESKSQTADNMTVVSGAQTERTIPVSKTRSLTGDESDMKHPQLPTESTYSP